LDSEIRAAHATVAKAHPIMPARYDGIGISLLYPDNWVPQPSDGQDAPGVVLETPGGAFFSIHRFAADADPSALLDRSVAAMREDYAELEESTWDRPIGAGRELDFYCLDLVITARLWARPAGDGCLLIHMQGESREFDRQTPVFDAMLVSLEQSLKPSQARPG
jgi:hypothetical protein